jgi:hypothetical protein
VSEPWGEAVNGLRARLVVPDASPRAGLGFRLTLEIQNVTDRPLSLEEPELPPSVMPRGFMPEGWAITCETRDGRRVRLVEAGRSASDFVRLGPGQTLHVEISLHAGDRADEKRTARREGEPLRRRMWFHGAACPGAHELRAVYGPVERGRQAVLEGGAAWHGPTLASPPVRVAVAP